MGSKRKRQTQDGGATAPPPKKQNKTFPQTTITHQPFHEDPKGPHLKREVELYEKLSSENPSERLVAAEAVIAGLFSEGGVSEPTLLRHLERRLFRGLASGRKGARLGFSLVITEILGQLFGAEKKEKYSGIRLEQLLELLDVKTKPEGDLSGQEEKDHYLGRLFGLQCFVRAKILFTSESKAWQIVFEKLMDLSKKKPWIREECGYVIAESLAQMDKTTAEQILQKFQDEGLATTPEGVGIWITAKKLFEDIKFPSKPWGKSGEPGDNLQLLARTLKESSKSDDSKNGTQVKQTGNWNAQLHWVWAILLDRFLRNAQSGVDQNFKHFWKTAVDENLFSDNASDERKFWGFLLFQRALTELSSMPKLLEDIFSSNLVRCLINHASKEDRALHRAATKSLKVVVQAGTATPSIVDILIAGLTSKHGVYNFDRITKSKTIEGLLSVLESDKVESVVKHLYVPAMKTQLEEDRDVESRRQQFGDYVLTIVRRTGTAHDEAWNEAVLKAALPRLAAFAYTIPAASESCQPPISDKTRTLFKNRLNSAFTHILSLPGGFAYPTDLLSDLNTDAVSMDTKATEARDKALATLKKMQKKIRKGDADSKSSLQPLALLYALIIFELLNGEPDALSVLDELKGFYDEKFSSKSPENGSSEALIELLMSLVARPSKLLKKTCQLVFEQLTDDITPEGLTVLTDVLAKSENLKGQQELFDPEDVEEAAEQDGDGSDEDLDSDVEIIDVEEDDAESSDDESENEKEEDEEEDEESANDDEAAYQELDTALEAALGTHRADKDLAAESSDSDADMTDSEMLLLDDKLVEIFKQPRKQPNKKKENKDAKENVVNFKSSVLNLLEVYVKKQPVRSFTLLVPLLKAIRTTRSKDVAKKAQGVIITFAKAAKKITSEERSIKDKALLAILEEVHQEALQDPSQSFAKAASTASLLIAGAIARGGKKGNTDKVLDIYLGSLKEYMKSSKLHISFFNELLNWCQSMRTVSVV